MEAHTDERRASRREFIANTGKLAVAVAGGNGVPLIQTYPPGINLYNHSYLENMYDDQSISVHARR